MSLLPVKCELSLYALGDVSNRGVLVNVIAGSPTALLHRLDATYRFISGPRIVWTEFTFDLCSDPTPVDLTATLGQLFQTAGCGPLEAVLNASRCTTAIEAEVEAFLSRHPRLKLLKLYPLERTWNARSVELEAQSFTYELKLPA